MPRLVLHIGTHKTGTTAVQNTFDAARKHLARIGVIYPPLRPHTGHHSFLTDWIALPRPYLSPDGGRQGLQRLARQLRNTDHTLLLSSEEFSRAGGRGGCVDYKEVQDIFAGFHISVILVLREQWRFLQSVYLEIARNSAPPAPPELAASAIQTGSMDGLWCDYFALYQGLRRRFEAKDIHLIDYFRATEAPGGLPAEILQTVAPDLGCGKLDLANLRANASPPPIPAWAAQVVAGGVPPSSRILLATQEAFAIEYPGQRPSCIFTRDEIARLTAHFETSNNRLAEQVSAVQPNWGLTATRPASDMLFREDVRDGYWIRVARRLAVSGGRRVA